MNKKDAALIEYAHKQADFLKRLQRQITDLQERVTQLESSGVVLGTETPEAAGSATPETSNTDTKP